MTDSTLREQAITGAVPEQIFVSSDVEVMNEAQQIEACIVKNKGMIMGCLSSLPGPMLATVRAAVKYLLLTPLQYLLTLPLTRISKILEKFTAAGAEQPASVSIPMNSSDCTCPSIM